MPRSFRRIAHPSVLAIALAVATFSQAAWTQEPFQPLRPAPETSQAEEVTRGETVTNRSRPELDALGVPVGGFYLYPLLSVGEAFRDNIFDTQSNARSDAITNVHPSLRLQSNFGRHAIGLYGDADIGRYADHTQENYDDFRLGGQGRLDVVGRSHIDLGSSYRRLHEDRASPNDVGGVTPTKYSDSNVSLGGTAAFARLIARVDGSLDRFEYSNVRALNGTLIDNGGRDRDVYRFATQLGYELAPLRELFVRGSYNQRNYDRTFDASGFQRSSDGYELAIGANYDLTGVTFVELFVGYRSQGYDDPRLATASGVAAGARVIWNVTRLTTVTATLTRDVEETVIGGASSYFSTDAGVHVDHELLRNLILRANAMYGNDDFTGIARNDDRFEAGFGAIYQMNRYFSISGNYAFRARESNAAGQDFTENVLSLNLTARY